MVARDSEAIEFAHASRRGPQRTENQDSFGVFPRDGVRVGPPGRLLIVADGMGGHRGGREASQMAVHLVEERCFAHPGDPVRALEEGIQHANRRIFERSLRDPALQGMGTTCTAMLLYGSSGYLAHVGDSKAYRIRQGRMDQLSVDHTAVADLVRQELISSEQARTHEQRHALNRAVGVIAEVEVDTAGPIPLERGDVFVLCTDGLEPVSEVEIFTVASERAPQDACDALLQIATDRGGKDDATVVIARVHETSRKRGLLGRIRGK